MVVTFLKPTKLKLVFLVEWVLFILITATQGRLKTNHHILVAVYPLIILYLAACALTALSQHTQQLAQGWKLLGLALGLTMLDQVSKAIVIALVPYQTSIPIVDRWLYLAHEHNSQGSWVVSAFNLQSVGIFNVMQWFLALPFLCCSILCHRYYTATNRKSLWADVAFLGLFAGFAS
jgi:lipoprotein signal peptidase